MVYLSFWPVRRGPDPRNQGSLSVKNDDIHQPRIGMFDTLGPGKQQIGSLEPDSWANHPQLPVTCCWWVRVFFWLVDILLLLSFTSAESVPLLTATSGLSSTCCVFYPYLCGYNSAWQIQSRSCWPTFFHDSFFAGDFGLRTGLMGKNICKQIVNRHVSRLTPTFTKSHLLLLNPHVFSLVFFGGKRNIRLRRLGVYLDCFWLKSQLVMLKILLNQYVWGFNHKLPL